MASYHTSGPVFSSCCCCIVDSPLGNLSMGPANEPCDHQVTRTGPNGDHQTSGGSHSPGSCSSLDASYLYCGSHDRSVYCWKDKLELVWKREMASEVYSIPCVGTLALSDIVARKGDTSNTPRVHCLHSQRLPCLCACSVSGQVCIYHLTSGDLLGSFDLPWQVYSSPVLVDGLLIVGCRDNNLYCMEVELCSN